MQENKNRRPSSYQAGKEVKNIAALVPQAGQTEIAEISTLGLRRIFVQVQVTGNALDEFIIGARAVEDGPVTDLYSDSTDFTAPEGLLLACTGDLKTLAAGATGAFLLDCEGFYEVTVRVSSAQAAGSTINLYAGGA